MEEGIGGSVILGMEGTDGIGGSVNLGTTAAGTGGSAAAFGMAGTAGTEGTAGIGGSVTAGTAGMDGTVTAGTAGIGGMVTTGTVGIAGTVVGFGRAGMPGTAAAGAAAGAVASASRRAAWQVPLLPRTSMSATTRATAGRLEVDAIGGSRATGAQQFAAAISIVFVNCDARRDERWLAIYSCWRPSDRKEKKNLE